jgi:integrase
MVKKHLLHAVELDEGALPLLELTTERLEAFAVRRQLAGAKPATINRNLFPLRAACKMFARTLGMTIPEFPSLEVRNAREVFFERGEFERCVHEMTPAIRGPLWFSYFTGWRVHSEVLSLRWDDHIRWESSTIELPAAMTKGKKSRTFPFGVLPELDQLLREQREHTPARVPWVFHRFGGKPIRDFSRAWRKAIEKSGLSHKVPHDLRRTAARNLIRAGVPEKVVMQLVGWSTTAMLMRYHIVREDDLREAVAKLAGRAG